MKTLFPHKRRDLVSKGFMAAFSLALSAAIVSDVIWKAALKLKLAMVIILLVLLLMAWFICPPKPKKGEESDDII